MNAEKPKATRVTWTIIPLTNPSEIMIPADLPEAILWLITNSISGPGEIVNPNETRKKENNNSKFTIFVSLMLTNN